jgi:hypothetical protein
MEPRLKQQSNLHQKSIQGSHVFAILGHYHKEKRWDELPDHGWFLCQILNSEIMALPAKQKPASNKHGGMMAKAEYALRENSDVLYLEAKAKITDCIYRAFEKETTAYLKEKGLTYTYSLETIDIPRQTLRDNAVWALLRNYSDMCVAIESGFEIDLKPDRENIIYQVWRGKYDHYMSRILDDWVQNIWNAEGKTSSWLDFYGVILNHYPKKKEMEAAAIFNLRSEMGAFLADMAQRMEALVRAAFWQK